jgi:hypothetical protein
MSEGTAKVFSPAEAGRELRCSASTVKRLAADLRIDPLLTVSGARLFTVEHVARIKAERERRAREAVTR